MFFLSAFFYVLIELDFSQLTHFIIGIQPFTAGNLESDLLESFLRIDGKTGIDFTGSGSALDRMASTISIQCKFTGSFKREITISLQKYGTLRQIFSELLQMFSFICVKFHSVLLILYHSTKSKNSSLRF